LLLVVQVVVVDMPQVVEVLVVIERDLLSWHLDQM
jgi:hypothetical protein